MNRQTDKHGKSRISNNMQEQILGLVHHWSQAEREEDAAALDPLLDPEFRLVGPLGFVLNRPAVLERFRNGMSYTALSLEDIEVRSYGDAAVVIGALRQQASFQGQDSTGQFRVTLVAVRSAGKSEGWMLASLHYSPMAQAPAGNASHEARQGR